jgi:hypothetical protein
MNVRVTRPFALPCESQGVQMQTDVPMEVSEVCQFFCVNGPVLFFGMGARGKGQHPFPRPAM